MGAKTNDGPTDEAGGEDVPVDERVPSAAPDRPRYADLRLADGGAIVYDRENENAWIQSEAAVGLEAVA